MARLARTDVPLGRRAIAEGVGTGFLLLAIVGSGIMGTRLAAGNEALVLLANSLATGAMLVAILIAFAEISGAHLNPAVTLVRFTRRELAGVDAAVYVASQVLGAFAGAACAHVMFGEPPFTISGHARAGAGVVLGEGVATFGLVLVVLLCARHGVKATAMAVAAYIVAGYWCTSSTSFANPAVTLARSVSDTFVGIRPGDVPGFLFGQAAGATAAALVGGRLALARETSA